MLEAAKNLGDAEQPHAEQGDLDTVGEPGRSEGEAQLAGCQVWPDSREQHAHQDHHHGLEHGSARQQDCECEPHQHERKILRWPEDQRDAGQRRGEGGNHQCRNRAGDEGAYRRDPKRNARSALARHLMAVDCGDDSARLAGDIEQDRGGGAAILGAVIDAGQHDQRGGRIEPEGQREQDSDGRDRPDPRQDADQRPQHAAGKAEQDIGRRQRDAEAVAEILQEFHARLRS